MPLTAVSKLVERTLYNDVTDADRQEEVERDMDNEIKFSMVMAVVNRGYVDDVMEAAKGAGARGGTVLHARSVGNEEVGNFFGITLQPEKTLYCSLYRKR